MVPAILFRKDITTEAEFKAAQKHFSVIELRSEVLPKTLVIGRYSTLPYYKELTLDLNNKGSRLINSAEQYNWIANFDWYEELKDLTFETWFKAQDLPDDSTQFIVKGALNSRKFDWDNLMHAKNKADAIRIMIELSKDSTIGTQQIIFRRYEPLLTYEVGNNGLPFANEWRFFYFNKKLIDFGYYWNIAKKVDHSLSGLGIDFANQVAFRASKFSNFFSFDIAQRVDGSWRLVELNDGQSAGLSGMNPNRFYKRLRAAVME